MSDNFGYAAYLAYDDMGRISQIDADSKIANYYFDQYGQLFREDNQALAKTFVYVYNNDGNLTGVKEYGFTTGILTGAPVTTTTFGYIDDQLTSFGGATIAYNAIGCPTSYEGMTAAWTKGKLSRLTKGSRAEGTETSAFNYNALGQRFSKTYSYLEGTSGISSVYTGMLLSDNRQFYYDNAGRLIAEGSTKTLYNAGMEHEKIVYLYDQGSIIGMQYTLNSVTNTYYFHRNPMGDVVGIYDLSGNLVAKYTYDAWGNFTISGNTAVAKANPIRYRGYYYDEETGLYYCNARYYSPKWRRFISPDSTSYLDAESVNGLNQYCYCNNDPVTLMKSSNPSVGSATVFTACTGISMAVANLHPGAIDNPDIPGWISDAVGAYSDVKLGMRYLFSKGMHAKFAYGTRTRFMFPKMGKTWCWFKRSSSRFANFGIVAQGAFKQIIAEDARAGLKLIGRSVGKMFLVNLGINAIFNLYENDMAVDWNMIGDTLIDTAIDTASTLLAAGTMSLITAGVVAAGLSMPGLVVMGGVILLSFGIEWVIREIFDYPD